MMFMLFDGCSKQPLYIVKIDRPLSGAECSDRELHTIQSLKERLPAKLSLSLPRIVHTGIACNLNYSVQEYINGSTLHFKFNSINYPNFSEYLRGSKDDIIRAFEWLIEFHRTTCSGTIKIDDETIEHSCMHLLDKSLHYLNLEKEQLETLKDYRSKLGQLKNIEIPKVKSHGDFGISNIIKNNNNTCSIIDWEFSQDEDWPFYDVMNLFYTYYYSDSNEMSLIRERHNGFSCDNDSFIMGSCFRQYAEQFNINLTNYDFYMPIFYARKALNDSALGVNRKEIWRFMLTDFFSKK